MRLKMTDRVRLELASRIAGTNTPHRAGLRISRKPGTTRLRVGMVGEASPGDVVVDDDGVRVYCGPVAARRLDGRSLDVRRDGRGRVEFVTRRQSSV